MNILCVGDVVGSAGCRFLHRILPTIKHQYAVDICIVNGENSADGNGITPASAKLIFDSGADVITGVIIPTGGRSFMNCLIPHQPLYARGIFPYPPPDEVFA